MVQLNRYCATIYENDQITVSIYYIVLNSNQKKTNIVKFKLQFFILTSRPVITIIYIPIPKFCGSVIDNLIIRNIDITCYYGKNYCYYNIFLFFSSYNCNTLDVRRYGA